jgi:type IV secretory pathway VirB3-like protein
MFMYVIMLIYVFLLSFVYDYIVIIQNIFVNRFLKIITIRIYKYIFLINKKDSRQINSQEPFNFIYYKARRYLSYSPFNINKP